MRQGTYDPTELEQSLSAHSVEYLLKAECIELPSINGDNLLGWASQVEAYLAVQDLLVATRAASTVGINLQGGKDTVLVQGNEGGRTRIGLGEIEISSVYWY